MTISGTSRRWWFIDGSPVRTFEQSLLNTYFKVDDQLNKEATVFSENENLAYMSDDLIDFRDSATNCTTERIVLLHNVSKSNPFKFEFTELSFSRSFHQLRIYQLRSPNRHLAPQPDSYHQGHFGPKRAVFHFRNRGPL